MKKTFTIILIVISFCVGSIVAEAASYGKVDIQIGLDYYLNLSTRVVQYENNWWAGPTGRLLVSYSNPTIDMSHFSQNVFCIETQTVHLNGVYTYDIVDAGDAPSPLGPGPNGEPMGTQKADYLSELFGRYFTSTNSNVNAAAFAIAAREIVFDDKASWDLITGNYQVLNDQNPNTVLAINQATNWLNTINGNGPKADLFAFSNIERQDFAVIAVPEPMTFLALASGLGALGMGFYKKLKI